jgi:hypothetical protein
MSGDKERFLFEELMRGVEEMAQGREVYSSITQGLVETIETPKELPYLKVTENGEITLDPTTNLYTAWDETYSDTICVTGHLPVAKLALEWYCKECLGEGGNE